VIVERRWSAVLGLALAMSFTVSVAAADKFPDGCVSCHTEKPGMADRRIDSLLRDIGHHYIRTVREVPGDCYNCHSPYEDKKYLPFYPDFGTLVHSIHYEGANTNTYITIYGGDCRGCHVMDVADGDVGVKGGPKNW
jgi:hypothetical protein